MRIVSLFEASLLCFLQSILFFVEYHDKKVLFFLQKISTFHCVTYVLQVKRSTASKQYFVSIAGLEKNEYQQYQHEQVQKAP